MPLKVETEFDPAADFPAHKTFAFAPLDTRVPGATPGDILRAGPAMRDAARQSMLGKGYTEVSEMRKADVVIRVHGKLVPKTEVTDWGFVPAYPNYRWYQRYPYAVYGTRQVTVDTYTEGTLIIEAHDVRTREMIWVGWITGRREGGRDKVLQQATDAVTRILAAYPQQGTRPAAAVSP